MHIRLLRGHRLLPGLADLLLASALFLLQYVYPRGLAYLPTSYVQWVIGSAHLLRGLYSSLPLLLPLLLLSYRS